MTVQTTYDVNPGRGFPGGLAEPSAPHFIDSGVLHVPTGQAHIPTAGDAVYWNTTENAFATPVDAASSVRATGILTFRKDIVQTQAGATEFVDGAEIEVALFGCFWVVAGTAVEWGDTLTWDRGDFKWNAFARVTTISTMHIRPVEMASRMAGVDNSLVKARIGYGRVL
jgi:hypothetical protein